MLVYISTHMSIHTHFMYYVNLWSHKYFWCMSYEFETMITPYRGCTVCILTDQSTSPGHIQAHHQGTSKHITWARPSISPGHIQAYHRGTSKHITRAHPSTLPGHITRAHPSTSPWHVQAYHMGTSKHITRAYPSTSPGHTQAHHQVISPGHIQVHHQGKYHPGKSPGDI